MTGQEKTRMLNDALQPLFFPYGAGDEVFDVVAKRKAMILQVKWVPEEYNPRHVREMYILLRYSDTGKEHKITSDTLHRRFLPITQLMAIYNEYEKYRDSWISNFVSGTN